MPKRSGLPLFSSAQKASDCTTFDYSFSLSSRCLTGKVDFLVFTNKSQLSFTFVSQSIKNFEKFMFMVLLVLFFPLLLPLAVSPQPPSFLKFPNKSQQIDTYLLPSSLPQVSSSHLLVFHRGDCS